MNNMPEFHIDHASEEAVCLNRLTRLIHAANVAAGWWSDAAFAGLPNNWQDNNLVNAPAVRYVIPTKLALAHSELSEALEGFRKGLADDHLPHRSMIEVELADTIIRILDIAGALELDIGGALVEKFNYNQTRADHTPEARNAPGGKSV